MKRTHPPGAMLGPRAVLQSMAPPYVKTGVSQSCIRHPPSGFGVL